MNYAPSLKAKAAAELELRRRRRAREHAHLLTDVCAWIESQFYIPERKDLPNAAMQLEPYQRAVLREAYRRDPVTGKFVYDVVVWSDIKKSAKSSIAAAVMLHRAFQTEWGSFKVIANDLNQANSRVFYYIQRALALNPTLGSQAVQRNYKITLTNKSIIQAIPVDPKGEAGGNDDLIEWTELHAADSKAAQSMWSEMTISPTKHGYSQRWIDTYAGHINEAPILEQLYDLGVKQGTQLQLPDAPDDLEVYANGRLLVLWNTRPRMPWQTDEYYQSEQSVLTPNEFARMHRNQWAASTAAFVPAEWWHACKVDALPTLGNKSVVVGIDAATVNDSFAVVTVSRDADVVCVREAVEFRPRNGAIDFAEVEQYIRDLSTRYYVASFVYDPTQMHDMAQRLTRAGVGYFQAFQQGQPRLLADKALYDRIRDRLIIHDGNPTLTAHVLNANRKDEDGKLRIVKRAADAKIDAAVALSQACYIAAYLMIG